MIFDRKFPVSPKPDDKVLFYGSDSMPVGDDAKLEEIRTEVWKLVKSYRPGKFWWKLVGGNRPELPIGWILESEGVWNE